MPVSWSLFFPHHFSSCLCLSPFLLSNIIINHSHKCSGKDNNKKGRLKSFCKLSSFPSKSSLSISFKEESAWTEIKFKLPESIQSCEGSVDDVDDAVEPPEERLKDCRRDRQSSLWPSCWRHRRLPKQDCWRCISFQSNASCFIFLYGCQTVLLVFGILSLCLSLNTSFGEFHGRSAWGTLKGQKGDKRHWGSGRHGMRGNSMSLGDKVEDKNGHGFWKWSLVWQEYRQEWTQGD